MERRLIVMGTLGPAPRRSRTPILLALSIACALVLSQAALTVAGETDEEEAAALCEGQDSGVTCGPGNGRRTPGGGEKVPHTGWPAVTGILWQVRDNRGRRMAGGPDNDELLGHHGSDRLAGNEGHDILWGDWNPKNNNERQRDVLRGGAGNDWLYPSHGPSEVYGGPGKDHVWAYYGRGVIDCGPGKDTARVRLNSAFKVRNCETINHFCGFGSDGHGGCLKPGEKRKD
jgi:hypothetical protein